MVRTDPGVKKDTILITVERYLNEVDPAVRHLFDGIGTYLEKWRQIGSVFTEDRDELARVMKRLEDWTAGYFSLSVLCGSVLQLAAQVLGAYSKNSTIPPSCSAFASAESARYCVGRQIHGLPIGAVILAGRHQLFIGKTSVFRTVEGLDSVGSLKACSQFCSIRTTTI